MIKTLLLHKNDQTYSCKLKTVKLNLICDLHVGSTSMETCGEKTYRSLHAVYVRQLE